MREVLRPLELKSAGIGIRTKRTIIWTPDTVIGPTILSVRVGGVYSVEAK